ncbi:hypothetical protein [Streptomyces sp. NPDC088915]|uniref:hypothetical protein n=1 Tax=Streptomyces sp. NPDC088915 TaxID=3365912 RepID=UPI00380EAB58
MISHQVAALQDAAPDYRRTLRLITSSQALTTELAEVAGGLADSAFPALPDSRLTLVELAVAISFSTSASATLASALAADPLDGLGQRSESRFADMIREEQEETDVSGVLTDVADELRLLAGACLKITNDIHRGVQAAKSERLPRLTSTQWTALHSIARSGAELHPDDQGQARLHTGNDHIVHPTTLTALLQHELIHIADGRQATVTGRGHRLLARRRAPAPSTPAAVAKTSAPAAPRR